MATTYAQPSIHTSGPTPSGQKRPQNRAAKKPRIRVTKRRPRIRTNIKPRLDSSIRRHQHGHLNSESSKQRTCTKAPNSCSRATWIRSAACRENDELNVLGTRDAGDSPDRMTRLRNRAKRSKTVANTRAAWTQGNSQARMTGQKEQGSDQQPCHVWNRSPEG